MQPKDLLQKAQSSKVAFHKFVLLHRKYSTDLFCFFEGKDTQYYFPRINSVNENHHPIICGNKKSVLETYNFIKLKYKSFKTAFFVDSDFDISEEKGSLFYTCGYSIENYYCVETVFSKILKNEFFIDETNAQYNFLMNLFKTRQKEFHKSTSLFNLWYFTAKHKAKKENKKVNASLDDKFPKEFISFNLYDISSNYSLDDIKAKFPDAIEVTEEELKLNKSNFFSKDPVYLFRGKYEIEFFTKFLQLLIDDANKTKKILTKKTNFRIDPSLILSQLSQYAVTSQKLKDFLQDVA